ncbi:MAG: chemotaxis protein CheA, partial [Tissierellia bacterium]|nr:chemotaxis protein CheA [Tissierellia bacterium]
LTHHMESVFELFRSGKSSVTTQIISLIFACLDKLQEIVEDLREGRNLEYDLTELIASLNQVIQEANGETEVNEPDQNGRFSEISDIDLMIINNAYEMGFKAYGIGVKISDTCLMKGARAYVVINDLEKEGEIIQSNPSTEVLESGNFDNEFSLIYISKVEKQAIIDLIEGISEIDSVYVEELDKHTQGLFDIKEDIRTDKDKKEAKSGGTNAKLNQGMNQYIRVDLKKLDNFMNLVSELVIYRTRLENVSERENVMEIREPLENVARITTELQDLVLQLRMQPINVILNRFPRMVRDLSQELKKDIELIIEGEDTELDRTVVSELSEPLVHLIRNAADHGIESADRRAALGKDPKGTIKLSAYQEGNRVVITIQDDGKGLDPDKIRESAINKGLEVEDLDGKEIIQLIFDQGFSTRNEVTSISGRGVGLDVVRQKIESLGGDIEVVSQVDKGTSFIVKLPLTLSIIQSLMVEIGGSIFALPLGVIERVIKLEEDELVAIHGDEVYIYKNRAIPVTKLNERLNLENKKGSKHIVIVLLGDQYHGLIVDELLGQEETVIKKLGSILGDLRDYLGATILGNGDITLILDVSNICNEEKEYEI